MLVRSLKGKLVDITSLLKENENAIAVTGSGIRMNARGDLLGPGGVVIKTKEELDKEYAVKLENSVKNTKTIGLGSTDLNRFQPKEEKIISRGIPRVQNVNEYIDVNDPDFEEKLKKQIASATYQQKNKNLDDNDTKKHQLKKQQNQPQKTKNSAPDEILDEDN